MTYTNAEKMILTASPAPSGDCLGQILNELGNPEKTLKIIKIFGECGKSSVCALLSATLSASAYKVGHVVTPFIHYVRNCIRIYERPISIELFSGAGEKIYKAVATLKKAKTDGEEFVPSSFDLLFTTTTRQLIFPSLFQKIYFCFKQSGGIDHGTKYDRHDL